MMDLRSGCPFWLIKNGFSFNYPSLQQHITTDVVVLGGGITGALMAHFLSKAGIGTVVVDRRNIGMGSTCASTALLQYEIDMPLHLLAEIVGTRNAQRSYQLCMEAIHQLKDLCQSLPDKAGFSYQSSLYYASKMADKRLIELEYRARKQMGIELELLSTKEINEYISTNSPKALLSSTAAQVDPYQLAHGLLQQALQSGIQVFDNTEVSIDYGKRMIVLTSKEGYTITCRKLIHATGYEAIHLIDKPIARLHSTYALASEPLEDFPIWKQNCLIWETARPYLYLRTTSDNRVMLGGKDIPFYSPSKRDKLLNYKVQQLMKHYNRLRPNTPIKEDYRWCGTFAETKDGLPFIGTYKQPHVYYALGFGGNGITFSTIAAAIIRDHILGKKNENAPLFSFDR